MLSLHNTLRKIDEGNLLDAHFFTRVLVILYTTILLNIRS